MVNCVLWYAACIVTVKSAPNIVRCASIYLSDKNNLPQSSVSSAVRHAQGIALRAADAGLGGNIAGYIDVCGSDHEDIM